ncbi:MAG TPA: helix-turn-helix domain-containing protein [Micropepsaceae bacterium]|jgi:DNA-binding IclR family transcriptional regulator
MSSSAARALRILDWIARAGRPLGVSEIAREASLAPGTVFRSLDALVRADFIARYQASARYVPANAVERLRRSVIAGFRMREPVLPYLRQLASASGETVSLHVRLGWYGVRIASALGTAEVTSAANLGETQPLGDYYAGKAMLAFLSEAHIARYGDWLAGHGVPFREQARELHAVKKRGFASGDADFTGARAVAFPIRSTQEPIAAIAIEGPVLPRTGEHHGGFSDWRETVAHVEALARAQAGLFENPFAHLDPNSLIL